LHEARSFQRFYEKQDGYHNRHHFQLRYVSSALLLCCDFTWRKSLPYFLQWNCQNLRQALPASTASVAPIIVASRWTKSPTTCFQFLDASPEIAWLEPNFVAALVTGPNKCLGTLGERHQRILRKPAACSMRSRHGFSSSRAHALVTDMRLCGFGRGQSASAKRGPVCARSGRAALGRCG